MSDRQDAPQARVGMLATKISSASRCISQLARPWLTQLVLRLALAVPFYRSGILKWHGFLQLNDTAIDLFTDEFKLHLPGGPYSFPEPAVVRFCPRAARWGFRCCWCWVSARASQRWACC